MPMPIEAKDIAVGDWSPNYGTVTVVKEHKDRDGNILGYSFDFFNGSKLTNVKPEFQIDIEQDGARIIHEGMPNAAAIRPGLGADHGKN